VIESDEILNNCIGTPFKNQAQLLYNSAYIGFNSKLNVATGVPNLKNIKYDCFLTDTMTETNMQYDSTNDFYWGPTDPDEDEYSVYDDCDDSSIDTDLWTTYELDVSGYVYSNVTENGTSMNLLSHSADNEATSAYAETKLLSLTDNSMVMFSVPKFDGGGTGTGSPTGSLYVRFGGVDLLTGNLNTDKTNLKFQIIKVSSQYYYRIFEGTWGEWTDFSPTSDLLRLGISADGNDGTAHVELSFNNVRYNSLTTPLTGTSYIVSAATSASVLDCFATYNAEVGPEAGSEVEMWVSSDNGANYEQVTDSTIHRFTDTGSSLIVKLILKGAGAISEYAVLYNLGAA
jgi:hypothetical protein